MSRVKKLERAVRDLTPEEFRDFRAWLAEYDQARWDEQLEKDEAAGRLESLAREARAEYERGDAREL